MLSLFRFRRALLPLLLLAVAACKKNDPAATATPDENAPILNADQTGWERVGRVPLISPAGIDFANAMTAFDLQLSGTDLRVVYRENRNLSGTDAPAMFKATVPAGGVGTGVALRLTDRQPNSGGSTTYNSTYFFKPDSYEAYQAQSASSYSSGSVATTQVIGETGQVLCTLNGNGGTFSGATPQMLADGTVLVSNGTFRSGTANGAVWCHWLAQFKGGRWLQAISQGTYGYSPHLTYSFQAVRMPSGRLYGATVLDDGVAIADTMRTTPTAYHSLPVRAFTTFAGYKPGDHIVARVVGNAIVFTTWSIDSGSATFSAYRWAEGASTVQRLYANVVLPAIGALQSEVQLDDNGAAWFFANTTTPSGLPAVALMRVDAAGMTPVSKPVNLKGLYSFTAPRQLNGQWYAALGPTFALTGAGNRNMDLVRLK